MTASFDGPITISYFGGFPGHGAAGAARLILADAGVEFTDNRVSREDWPALKKKVVDEGNNPAGTMPFAQIGDRYLTQTAAITGYFAEKLGYGGDNVEDRYKLAVATDFMKDYIMAYGRARFSDDPKFAEDFKNTHKPKNLAALEKVLTTYNNNPFVLGDKPAYADFVIFAVTKDTQLEDADWALYPHIKKLVDAVGARERIQAWHKANGYPY